MDGWITIGTKLDSSQLDKDLKQQQRQLSSYEKEAERLTTTKSKVEVDLEGYEKAKQEIQASTDETLKQAQTQEQVQTVLDMEQIQLQQLNEEYAKPIGKLEEINKKIQENATNQEAVKKQIQETTEELGKQSKLSGIQGAVDNVGTSLKNTVNHVARWGLALIGVRSVYSGIRRAVSLVEGENEQVATNIEGMKNVVANALLPLVQAVVRAIARVMVYINYIFKAFTGKNLFNFSKTTKSASDNLKSGAKHAKEINKQLAGFDEQEVLQDNTSDTGDAGGIGGGALPFDKSLFDVPIPAWLKWIVDNKDLILGIFAGVVAGLLAWKLGMEGIQALGFGLMIAGIVFAIEGLIAYLKDPSWDNFGKIITGIGIAIVGLGILIGNVPVIIAGVVIAILGIIISNWEKIKQTLQGGIDWLTGKSEWVHKYLGDTIGAIYDTFVSTLQGILNWFDSIFTNMKLILDGLIQFVKGVFTGNWSQAWNGLKTIMIGIWNIIVSTIRTAMNLALNIVVGVVRAIGSAIKGIINGVIGAIESVLNVGVKGINALIKGANKIPGVNIKQVGSVRLPRLAKGGIINQPGRGVPIGNAIAGERGQEGVIPLTDSQQMELLGESIGRYVTINATVINKMNGRVLSKELQKVQNENDFATNN